MRKEINVYLRLLEQHPDIVCQLDLSDAREIYKSLDKVKLASADKPAGDLDRALDDFIKSCERAKLKKYLSDDHMSEIENVVSTRGGIGPKSHTEILRKILNTTVIHVQQVLVNARPELRDAVSSSN